MKTFLLKTLSLAAVSILLSSCFFRNQVVPLYTDLQNASAQVKIECITADNLDEDGLTTLFVPYGGDEIILIYGLLQADTGANHVSYISYNGILRFGKEGESYCSDDKNEMKTDFSGLGKQRFFAILIESDDVIDIVTPKDFSERFKTALANGKNGELADLPTMEQNDFLGMAQLPFKRMMKKNGSLFFSKRIIVNDIHYTLSYRIIGGKDIKTAEQRRYLRKYNW